MTIQEMEQEAVVLNCHWVNEEFSWNQACIALWANTLYTPKINIGIFASDVDKMISNC